MLESPVHGLFYWGIFFRRIQWVDLFEKFWIQTFFGFTAFSRHWRTANHLSQRARVAEGRSNCVGFVCHFCCWCYVPSDVQSSIWFSTCSLWLYVPLMPRLNMIRAKWEPHEWMRFLASCDCLAGPLVAQLWLRVTLWRFNYASSLALRTEDPAVSSLIFKPVKGIAIKVLYLASRFCHSHHWLFAVRHGDSAKLFIGSCE